MSHDVMYKTIFVAGIIAAIDNICLLKDWMPSRESGGVLVDEECFAILYNAIMEQTAGEGADRTACRTGASASFYQQV
jgi:hypothetical protein